MSKPVFNPYARVAALYLACRDYLKANGTIDALLLCVGSSNAKELYPTLDIPRYMFTSRPVTSTTWMELQEMQLDTYMLAESTGLLVDPVTREYCYVYWDEADQCSNPYMTHQGAVNAYRVYVANL